MITTHQYSIMVGNCWFLIAWASITSRARFFDLILTCLTKVIRFAIYAFIATFVIKARSQVEDLSIANDGTKSALTEQYFEYEPKPRKFEDIKDAKDVRTWLQWLFNSLQAAGNTDEYSNPLSLNLHNRVTPTEGVCLDSSSITMTFRRVKLSSNAESSTTTRFSPLYPKTWTAFTIQPGETSSDEETSPIVAATSAGILSWLYSPSCKSCPNAGSFQESANHFSLLLFLICAETSWPNWLTCFGST